jgi:hypothetical protein
MLLFFSFLACYVDNVFLVSVYNNVSTLSSSYFFLLKLLTFFLAIEGVFDINWRNLFLLWAL